MVGTLSPRWVSQAVALDGARILRRRRPARYCATGRDAAANATNQLTSLWAAIARGRPRFTVVAARPCEESLAHHCLLSRERSAAAEAHNILRAACRTPPLIAAFGDAPPHPLMPTYPSYESPPRLAPAQSTALGGPRTPDGDHRPIRERTSMYPSRRSTSCARDLHRRRASSE
jgi:hypothetical protein